MFPQKFGYVCGGGFETGHERIASGSLPNWFDGLPIDNGFRYVALAVAPITADFMPSTPPNVLLTRRTILTLYTLGSDPAPTHMRVVCPLGSEHPPLRSNAVTALTV